MYALVAYGEEVLTDGEEDTREKRIEKEEERKANGWEGVVSEGDQRKEQDGEFVKENERGTCSPQQKLFCDPELLKRVRQCLNKPKRKNITQTLRDSKNFNNPDILEKLVSFCGINEIGTNYPPELFNPFRFEPSDYYTELLEAQRKAQEQRELEKSGRKKIDFVSSSTVPPSPLPGPTTTSPSVIKPIIQHIERRTSAASLVSGDASTTLEVGGELNASEGGSAPGNDGGGDNLQGGVVKKSKWDLVDPVVAKFSYRKREAEMKIQQELKKTKSDGV